MNKEFLLSCDVGGTNTTIALVERDRSHFHLHALQSYSSQRLTSLLPALEDALGTFNSLPTPSRCCISGAGPVSNNVCRPSNVPWLIQGEDIARKFSMPTKIINDFTAVVYALPLLNPEDSTQLIPLPHTQGSLPPYQDEMFLAVGAGTGLGVGALMKTAQGYVAIPSEGGHADLSPFDDISIELWRYCFEKYQSAPGAEVFVSGPGICRLFEFWIAKGYFKNKELCEKIVAAPQSAQAALIATHAETDKSCLHIMEYFIRLYGKVAANTALNFAGKGNLFISGGIVTKNMSLFSKDQLFMQTFEKNYHPHLQRLLRTVPIYLIVDYTISVYGAAHAISADRIDKCETPTISSSLR